MDTKVNVTEPLREIRRLMDEVLFSDARFVVEREFEAVRERLNILDQEREAAENAIRELFCHLNPSFGKKKGGDGGKVNKAVQNYLPPQEPHSFGDHVNLSSLSLSAYEGKIPLGVITKDQDNLASMVRSSKGAIYFWRGNGPYVAKEIGGDADQK